MVCYTAHMDNYGCVIIVKDDTRLAIVRRLDKSIVMAGGDWNSEQLEYMLHTVTKMVERGVL
jgi:hypothetical protein